MSTTPRGQAPAEPRHFAPYGSTNAECDETVPRSVAWDERAGEYRDARFTVNRDRITCSECLYRLGVGATPEVQAPADVAAIIARVKDRPTITRMSHADQIEAIEALRDALERASQPEAPADVARWPAHWTDEDKLCDLHARYHSEEGNMLGRDDCGWDRCEFWDAAKFTLEAERRTHDRSQRGQM